MMLDWKVQCLIIVITMCLGPSAPYIDRIHKNGQLRWVDRFHFHEQRDSFFDRVVMIVLNETNNATEEVYMRNQSLIAPGFFINEITVLTSFNPFRKIIKDKERRKNIVIAMIENRVVDNYTVSYELDFRTIECARQVVPMHDQEFNNVWHGGKQDNSPLHDLMVIRLNKPVVFTHDKWLSNYGPYGKVDAGPVLTELAKPNEHLQREMRFASAGMPTPYDSWRWCCLHRTLHEVDGIRPDAFDNIERSCDKWLPKEWGHFICIDNMNNYPGLGSAAMLVSIRKLYGVGSFMIKRGGHSVLVFTDVRRYYNLIFKTCSLLDQDLGVTTPKTTLL